jgi:autotransporter adhesin
VFGLGNTVNATNAVVMGNSSTVTGANGVAIGNGVTVAGANAVAIGNGASAGFDNSVAIGNGAIATRANQQAFGTAGNTYTMPGITSAASRSAQSGPTQIVTSDAGGNLATTTLAGLGLASMGDINAINSQLAGINARLDDLTARSNKANTGVAMAFAMAGVPTLMPNESFAITMNWGTFQSANGLALNAAVRLDNHVQVNAGFGYGADQNLVGGRVGLRLGW